MKNIGLLLIFVGLLNPLYGNIISRANEGDLAGVQECVDNGAVISTTDKNGEIALMIATKEGHLDIVQQLVEQVSLRYC